MQTLTFVCRQDFGTWIMHCYSWIGRYRDTAACACVCVCLCSANAASRFVIAFRRDYYSPGIVLCMEAKLKEQFAQIWQLKIPCRHIHVCFRDSRISSLLPFSAFYLQTSVIFRSLKERISPNSFQGEETSVTCWQQKRKKEEISTSGWTPSSHLFDMGLWDMSDLFTWGNILQRWRRAKCWCFNVAIFQTIVVCFRVTPRIWGRGVDS